MKKEKLSPARRRTVIVNGVGIAVFIIILAVITAVLWPYVGDFFANPQKMRDFVTENGFVSVPVYLLLQVMQIVVAIIPGEALEIAAGAAFGWFWGLIAAEVGCAVGTTVIFLISRKFGRGLADAILGENKIAAFEKLNGSKNRDGIIFLIFVIPCLPKDLMTYAAAFFDIKLPKFLLLTSIARIPSIITSTVAADFIIEGNFLAAVLIFGLTAAVAIVCFFLSDRIMKKLNRE